MLIGGLFLTSSQKSVEAPQEPVSPAMTDNTIADNEHARTDARAQLEVVRVEVAAEKRRVAAEKLAKAVAAKKAEEVRKAEVARANELAAAKAKEEKKRVVVSRNSSAQGPTKRFEATFYTAFCNTGCTGETATGIDVRNTIYEQGVRIIAVDPSVIPLHSLVKVTLADGTTFNAIAGDTGGAIKGFKIDILVGSTSEANRLGRQSVAVKVLRNGK